MRLVCSVHIGRCFTLLPKHFPSPITLSLWYILSTRQQCLREHKCRSMYSTLVPPACHNSCKDDHHHACLGYMTLIPTLTWAHAVGDEPNIHNYLHYMHTLCSNNRHTSSTNNLPLDIVPRSSLHLNAPPIKSCSYQLWLPSSSC